ncbi:Brix-domain-containing protein [Violaceomyces palustris]|uniref:Brix-domain-containing protein n=1 Tax=Violaceomyces palustris TaxID=1673888 RepID=A0ACD0P5I4_9BASI|nr:Brix-domain-containing protein [Violaceomyces palustris]
MIRTTKPKNARSKRALEKKEAKEVENTKTAIFVRGPRTSEKVNVALTELNALKKPHSIPFSKKNDVLPFEDTSSLEFWSSKNDASLFVVGNTQKKRPDNLTWVRMFDGQVLDMIETGINAAKSMKEFKGSKPGLGLRPLFHFSGPQFAQADPSTLTGLEGTVGSEADPSGAYQHLKYLLLDFYKGEELTSNQIALSGLQHVICVTAAPSKEEEEGKEKSANGSVGGGNDLAALYEQAGLKVGGSKQFVNSPPSVVHFRVYTIKLLASGSRQPRVELEECGPSFDFVLRRRRPANEDMMNQALKKPKSALEKNKQGKGKLKNIETDDMGDMVGRIHVDKQDLGALQTRKMKGLKKGKGEDEMEEDDEEDDEDEDREEGDEEDESEIEYGQEDDSDGELDMEDMTMQDEDEDQEEEEVKPKAKVAKSNGKSNKKQRR